MKAVSYLISICIGHRLCHPLPLIVARPGANGIDMAPVPLMLGMHLGVPIHLRCGGEEKPGLHSLSQTQHVQGSNGVGFDCLDRVVHVLDWRGRGRQMVDLIHFQHQWDDNVMVHQLKVFVPHPSYMQHQSVSSASNSFQQRGLACSCKGHSYKHT